MGDYMAGRENGAQSSKSQVTPKPAPVSGGLFDEEEDEDDDFFSGKSLKKSSSGECAHF